MKYKFLTILAAAGLFLSGAQAIAADTAAHADKPVSRAADVKNMPDDAVVYIQGYIVDSLGDDDYVFKDDSGTVNIEIDEDLIEGNTIVPDAVVFITATVDKEGDITSLEAEEVDFLPASGTAASGK